MPTIQFHDGQEIDPSRITVVMYWTTPGEERLFVGVRDGDPLKVFGIGINDDVAKLEAVQEDLNLSFLVYQSPKQHLGF